MIISTAVSEVVVISQLKLCINILPENIAILLFDIKKNIWTICLKLKEYSNTKITIRLSLTSYPSIPLSCAVEQSKFLYFFNVHSILHFSHLTNNSLIFHSAVLSLLQSSYPIVTF